MGGNLGHQICEYVKAKGLRNGIFITEGAVYYLYDGKYCLAECLMFSLKSQEVCIECSGGIISSETKIMLWQQGEKLKAMFGEKTVDTATLDIFVLLKVKYGDEDSECLYIVFCKRKEGECIHTSFTDERICLLLLELYLRNANKVATQNSNDFNDVAEQMNRKILKAVSEVYIMGEPIKNLDNAQR